MFIKTEEWNALPSQKIIMNSSSYGKGEWLVSLIGNLLISWRIDMTIEKLIQKSYEFEKKNERITWKPHDFPEDMTESSTIEELISEGDSMYDALKEAVELISDLVDELEYKIEVED